jgi:hypothetical protein
VFNLATALVSAILLLPGQLWAQDAHYWSQQYGTRAELLGGAVVGSILDLSSTYYNPGALALMKDPSVLLSAKAFEGRRVTFEDQDGNPLGLEDRHFGPSPSLFTTLIPLSSDRIAFSVFTRETFEMNASAYYEGPIDLSGKPATAAGEYHIDYDVSDTWFGATWARPIQDGLGFGVTPYLTVRSQRNRQEFYLQAQGDSGVAVATFVDDYRYSRYGLLLKAGLSWLGPPWSAGFTVTTPSVGLGFLNDGDASFHRAVVGADLDGDGSSDDLIAFNSSEGLDSEFHTPLAIAAGFTYRYANTTLHLSGEWFDGIKPFSALDVEGLPSEYPGISLTRRLEFEAQSVLNVGVGLEHSFPAGWQLYGSFTTDFSAVPDESAQNHSLAAWDIYHLTGGGAVKIRGLDLTGGVGYSFGQSDLDLPPVFEEAGEAGPDPPALSVSYQRLKFIVGFAFTI